MGARVTALSNTAAHVMLSLSLAVPVVLCSRPNLLLCPKLTTLNMNYRMEMPYKLPIPRLRRERRESSGRRTSQACDSCRQRKIKCDGNRPTCSLCHAQGLDNCFYSDAKAVRQQRELELMKRKIENYEEMFRNILGELEVSTADQVAKALKVCICP
jgi:hypothetical protein